MLSCEKCGAERRLVGVRFPARHLCSCEKDRLCGANNCKAIAVIVEFQTPTKNNLDAPLVSDKTALLFCSEHGPSELVIIDIPKKPGSKKSNVDPQWSFENPPPSAVSHKKIRCWACRDIHESCARLMHNGTRSLCPKCGDDMGMPYEEDAA